MQLNYATKEEFLQKFLDSVDLKHIKPKKPHNNYVDMQDECLKDAKCIICTKATQSDVLVNFVFIKEFSDSIYNVVEGSHKAAVENSMSGFGELTWINNEGKNPYIQVRKSLDDFSKEEEIFAWYKDAVFAFYACVPFGEKIAECAVASKTVDAEKAKKESNAQKAELDRLKVETEKAKAELAAAEKMRLELEKAKAEAEKAKAAAAAAQAAAANIQTDDVRAVSTARTKDGHAYVDLGLPSRLKWATMNIGAEYEDDWGDYFQFGDVKVESTFGSDNNRAKRYDLSLSEDAAAQIWKGGWRMPSEGEYRELCKGCDWTWTDDYKGTGCPGMIGTSKKNQNQIFFPASGWKDHRVAAHDKGRVGMYNSSTSSLSAQNYVFHFKSEKMEVEKWTSQYGSTIRPVIE